MHLKPSSVPCSPCLDAGWRPYLDEEVSEAGQHVLVRVLAHAMFCAYSSTWRRKGWQKYSDCSTEFA